MGSFSLWHWLIVLAVVLLLFGGRGKISSIMGDFGKGLKSFKKGMKDEEDEHAASTVAGSVQHEPPRPMASPAQDPQRKPD